MSDQPIPTATRWRAISVTLLLSSFFVALGARAWTVQIGDGPKLRKQAARQHVSSVEVAAPRGEVVDRKLRPLAVTANAESVWANPKAVTDVVGTAAALSKLLDENVQVLEARLASPRHFAWISRHVTSAQAAAVRAAALPGIDLTEEPKRYYPARSSAATVLGSANLDGDGVDGVELAMNQWLTGERARATAVRDAGGRKFLAEGTVPARPGATVRLALHSAVQSIADAALAEAVALRGARAGTVVVLDVPTGEVLALANMPTFDPNLPRVALDTRNRAITDAYEIGSSMKVFTVAAALDAGAIGIDELIDTENGRYLIAGKRVTDVHHDGALTVGGVLKRSSNVGVVKVAWRLGKEGYYNGLLQLGFGRKTGIDLPGEAAGTVRAVANWRDVDFVTMAYGYGLAVTPIQMAAALAAIGNGGMYNVPRVVLEALDEEGKVVWRPEAVAPRRVLRQGVAEAMLPMLASVFEKGPQGGTAAAVYVPGYQCGGKTGTAHKYDPDIHGYAKKKYYSSFIGLAPIASPRLAIVVILDEPTTGDYFGGKVAVPVFAKIASEALRSIGVPNDMPWEDPRPKRKTVPAVSVADQAADAIVVDASEIDRDGL